MAVKVYGVDRLINQLDERFGRKRIDSIVDEALTNGALVFGMELRRQLATFSDGTGYSKGYTLDELTISSPDSGSSGNRSITIHWKGPHNRYRVIHLNEWGTIQNPSPRGKGKIAKAMELARKPYGKAVRDTIRRNL